MNNKLVDILNRGIRYLRYIPSFFRWILTAKNWYEIIFLHLNLIRRDIHLNLRNGLNLRLMNRGENSDTVTLSELYWDKPYTKDGFDIKNNDIVVDIGANVGIFSTYAVKQAKNVKVYSFEPSPATFKYLKSNIETNKLSSSIKIFNKAVADKNGVLKLYLNEEIPVANSLYQNIAKSKNGKDEEVVSVTLKKIFKDNKLNKINFLKLDCEGAEYGILMKSPVELLNKIEKISMEVHKIKGYSVQKLKNYLSGCGFEIKQFREIIHARRINEI